MEKLFRPWRLMTMEARLENERIALGIVSSVRHTINGGQATIDRESETTLFHFGPVLVERLAYEFVVNRLHGTTFLESMQELSEQDVICLRLTQRDGTRFLYVCFPLDWHYSFLTTDSHVSFDSQDWHALFPLREEDQQ